MSRTATASLLFSLLACAVGCAPTTGGGETGDTAADTGDTGQANGGLDTATAAGIADLLATADPNSGSAIYAENCRRCHGANATGSTTSPSIAGVDAERVIEAVLTGPGRMPTFPLLSDQDVADVALHVSGLGAR